MDEMKIVSRFTRNVISKLIKRILKKKLGYDVDLQLNELNVSIIDGKAHVHINVDAELDNSEVKKLLKNIGLD